MKNKVYLYVFDTMADWEIGYLSTEINSGRYYKKGLMPLKIVTVGINKNPITTMGGLEILPEIELRECSIEETVALILPGGNTWTEAIHAPIIRMAEECLEKGIVVGAICGATIGLAMEGVLNKRAHTSNDLGYLKMVCPSYSGEKYYKQEYAVTDRSLITASGIAPLEFTLHILKILEVFSPQTLDSWYNLYKTQDAKYFFELMSSIQ
ncbi:type 1 glutamine amidotransferase family protein [Clostridium estertheticum]|uniref:type 1 glutamine amidotransferase family protein n=1 Tax=Clostridium estertheticum TaxID=238834 RepID=UPI001CF1C309|nr:type 1 glutamine amidotransferase family protein [Clostridium estertheticum]MCB2356148.1 glutamine amidotransferase [Clostridium estertheticum]WAG43703.1 glutamine amidotransferase [Clostridium estertheticum]